MSQEKGPRRFQMISVFCFGMFPYICFPHLSGHMFFLRPGWITFVVDCALWRAVVPWWWMCTGWWFGKWLLFFHSVGNVIIPTDELIFFRRARSTTKQFMIPGCLGLGLGWPWPDPAPCGAMWRPRKPLNHEARVNGEVSFPSSFKDRKLASLKDRYGPRIPRSRASEVMSCGWKGCGEWVVQNGQNLTIFGGWTWWTLIYRLSDAFRCSAEVHGLGPSPNPNVESQMLRFTLR